MANAKMSHPKDTTGIIYDKSYLLGSELKTLKLKPYIALKYFNNKDNFVGGMNLVNEFSHSQVMNIPILI